MNARTRKGGVRTTALGAALAVASILAFPLVLAQPNAVGQPATGSQLASQISYENNLRHRLESALADLLGHRRFIVEVEAELIQTPTVRRETIYEPSSTSEAPMAERVMTEEPADDFEWRSVLPGLPLLPFERRGDPPAKKAPAMGKAKAQDATMMPQPAAGEMPDEGGRMDDEFGANDVRQVTVEQTTWGGAGMSRLDVTVILPDGTGAAEMEMVRQMVPILAHLNLKRGDNLRILTSTFGSDGMPTGQPATVAARETPPQQSTPTETAPRPAPTISQSELQLRDLENQLELQRVQYENQRRMMLAGGAVGAALLLLLIVTLSALFHRSRPAAVAAPEPMAEPEPELEPEPEPEPEPAPAPAQAAPSEVVEVPIDPKVVASEARMLRQSIVTEAVGRPQLATSIVHGWLSENGEKEEGGE